ncbi:uncharacterized protein PAF06_019321 [Gastrophryne carolinensis]
MSILRKRVSFNEKPVFLGSAGKKDAIHNGVLQHYQQHLVKNLSLTAPIYRKLKENGILTTDQIGALELEESTEQKISKFIDVLKRADHHVFTTFCAILHETGQHQLAKILQKAMSSKSQALPEVLPVTQHKQLSETIRLHQEYERTMKQENEDLKRKIKRMKTNYMHNLRELEDKITIAKWERDLAIKEKNILYSENEALQNLNTELQALIRKLQDTVIDPDRRDPRAFRSNIQDLGLSVDYLQEKSRRFYPQTHLGLVYR